MPYRASRHRKRDPVVIFALMAVGIVILAAATSIYMVQDTRRDVVLEGKSLGIAIADRFVDTDSLRRSDRVTWEPAGTASPPPPKPGGRAPSGFQIDDE